MANFESALDGAKAVMTDELGDETTVFVVWHGGTTFNVYTVYDGNISEIYAFNVSDDKGRPVDYDTAIKHMEEQLEETLKEEL